MDKHIIKKYNLYNIRIHKNRNWQIPLSPEVKKTDFNAFKQALYFSE
mgnify:CR=1 FL=1